MKIWKRNANNSRHTHALHNSSKIRFESAFLALFLQFVTLNTIKMHNCCINYCLFSSQWYMMTRVFLAFLKDQPFKKCHCLWRWLLMLLLSSKWGSKCLPKWDRTIAEYIYMLVAFLWTVWGHIVHKTISNVLWFIGMFDHSIRNLVSHHFQ